MIIVQGRAVAVHGLQPWGLYKSKPKPRYLGPRKDTHSALTYRIVSPSPAPPPTHTHSLQNTIKCTERNGIEPQPANQIHFWFTPLRKLSYGGL